MALPATALPASMPQREFAFTDQDFRRLRDLVMAHTGICLSDAKRDMVYGRLSRRLRQLGLDGFQEYCALIDAGHEDEIQNFVNAVTTNLTSFFRENHHFEHLGTVALPELVSGPDAARRVRIWSAGSSTGEEPYSIAITVREKLTSLANLDLKILATDLDTDVLEQGRQGIYDERRVEGLDPARVKRWFIRGTGANAGKVRVRPALQELIRFKPLNLMGEWPMSGPFDVIFCRNVLIYFDQETQARLVDRFAQLLSPRGWLYIGHSETLHRVSDRFELQGQTIYRRVR